ncbi:nuclear pore complex protein Nup58 [Coccinella septempunctata]|uniref:nuclear pore complex protein Nup58 n=1 Tax=Coccinella septempunctata TaxID=41139 RepID=UPI001D076191|nr:nuclear pore complex protein Nup58 [Coccinella septempunctata]
MSSGFSFGAKTTAPAFPGMNTQSFGAAPTNNQFSFGSNTQQPSSGFQLNLSTNKPTSAVAPQPTGFSLGPPNATVTTSGLSFGAIPASTTAATPALNLGTNTNTPGFSFGTPASTAISQATPAGGLGFGGLTTATPNLGAPTTSTPNFGLGSTAATTASTGLSTGFTLGSSVNSAVTSASGFTLGGASSSAAPNFGFGTKTTATSSLTAPSTGSTFGTASTAAPTLNFGFSTNTSTTGGGLNFGTSTASTGFSLNTPSTSAAPVKIGLGGIQTSTSSSLGTTTAKEVPPKEQQVPNEIQQDIENFKNYIKQQKIYSSDVSRCCVKDFRSVEAQIGVLNNVIKEIESQLERNRSLAEKLKYDTAQGLQLLEMAQRTQDTPAGLQYENQAPMNFFLGLADKFEKEMHALKIQIENTDKYVKNFGQPATLTSQDLSLGMKRLHDTFVALAGRLQSVHTQVESQKELFINLRKQLANDFSNPFELLDKKLNSNQAVPTVTRSPPKIACGPTPFNQIMTSNFPIMSQQNVGASYPGMGNTTGFGSASVPGFFGNTSSLNQTNTNLQNTTFSFQNSSLGSNFQLQKPPTGNKRGKQ